MSAWAACRLPIFSALAAAALLFAQSAAAEIVRWVDEQGNIHYSDHAPTGAAKSVEQVKVYKDAGVGADQKTVSDDEQKFRKRMLERKEAEAVAEKQAQDAKVREQNCISARNQVRALNEAGRLVSYDDKGERVYLDDTQRAEAIRKAEESVKSWCNP